MSDEKTKEKPIIKNKKRKAEFSAIGTWDGFVFQGVCGVYHALKLIKENEEAAENYLLQYEVKEDFSIMDTHINKVLSLHQCKIYKGSPNFETFYTDMIEKHNYHDDCDGSEKLWFHCNQNLTPPDAIRQYEYAGGVKCWNTLDVMKGIKSLIEEINPTALNGSIFCHLISKVEYIVGEIHAEFLKSGDLLKDITPRFGIPFHDIIDIVHSNGIDSHITEEWFVNFIKMQYCGHISTLMKEDEELSDTALSYERAEKLMDVIQQMPTQAFIDFLKRVNPDENIYLKLNSVIEIGSKAKIQPLYNLSINTELLSDNGNWVDKEYKLSPSTLGKDCPSYKYASRIYNNGENLNVLREYDWIVGCFDTSLNNIIETIHNITHVEPDEEESPSIFNLKKVGLLTLEDKNNKKYPN